MRRPVATRLAGALAVVGLLSGCGLSPGSAVPLDVGPGSITPVLDGVEVTVGSKDFTENIVLGYVAEFALQAAGAEVSDLTNIQGSQSARQALLTGQVDLYWDYTGTAWITYLGNTDPIPDGREQFEAVRAADVGNGVAWQNYTALNNTYSFGVDKEVAARLGVTTISDLARLARERPEEATFCLETEFASRNDGMPGLQRAYEFTVPQDNVRILGTGPIYQAAADADVCNFGEIFTTDGRILALDLQVLVDDRKFFPQYNAALAVRRAKLDEDPRIAEVLAPVAAKLDNDVMLRLNARVDVDGEDPADVARDWLVAEGFVTKG
ncbi:glycine betaine ABC transporter substrate-binding protein [Umezawaea beigongshangensis]|uniref:glycine betaine ABC transporter substrate-binding protein n=1 Tax=Umezawaea beigongshangensis TaxID=2780383 RepID=UPI0018F1C808|nr:glycine betaine ABC transporter substrate-binding protein [Umezawaea beigongshangensis]